MIKIFKFVVVLLFFSLIFGNANSNNFKIKDLEIELFDKNKLISSSRIMTEDFGYLKVKVFAEKIDKENFGSIIMVVYSKIDKYGQFIRTFLLDYLFNKDNSIFNKDDSYHYVVNKNRTNAFQVKEFDLQKFIKRSDDFNEVRSALKGAYKKSSLKNNDRVIKSDHVYLTSNGNLVWVSHMFNYETKIKENHFQGGKSKFHPKNINEFPKYKSYMDHWSSLAFKRHDEFQKALKIKSQIDLISDGFDKNENLDYYEKNFYSSNISDEKNNINEDERKAKEQKAKEEKERKAKEEQERKAKEEQERKAKEEQERKAKEQKAKEEKERKAKEQKAKEEKKRKVEDETLKSKEELSVDDLMSKIKELNEMFKSGLISKEEFEILKGKLLKN